MSHVAHGPIRAAVLALKDAPSADVLIIGAGINGIALFRDLALQGIDVAIVDRSDFASGASAASSHMIHGGIRYLENGEFRLVKESVQERNALLKTAPHYVKPLKTTVPIYSTFSGILSAPLRFLTHRQGKPTERGAALIKIGLTLYDSFSRAGGTVPRHQFHGRKKSLRELPALDPRVKYTATYFDASMHDPERLALDVLRDGREAEGARVRAANYVEAVGASESGVRLRDLESGTEFDVSARLVVNTSGPWTDLTNASLGTASRFMGGTKGSHIVLDHPELLAATGGREIFFEHSDCRIVLIYPFKGRVLVGTTDLEHDMREPIRCTEEEVDYFFDLIAHVFPSIEVSRDDIVFRFSGVRPLPRHDDTKPGFVSRDYRIEQGSLPDGTPLLSLVGGKWTTFRALGEHLADEVLGRLNERRRVSTAGRMIGGGAGFPTTPNARRAWLLAHEDTLGADRANALLERYGSYASRVIDHIVAEKDAPLAHAPEYSVREIDWIARHEDVVRLLDVVLRRTSLAFRGSVTTPLLEEIAEIAGTACGWDDARRAREITESVELLREAHGLELAPLSASSSASA